MPRAPDEKTAGIHARLEPVTGLAIQFLMLTLTRRTEVVGAMKAEFDREAGLWIIPAARAKAKHPHVVPLGSDCLRGAGSGHPAKARAHALCAAGDLHGAVLSMSMDMSRRTETASSHMDVLARAGLAIALAGSVEQVAGWIDGFR